MTRWKPATYRQVAIIALLVAVLLVDAIVIVLVVNKHKAMTRIPRVINLLTPFPRGSETPTTWRSEISSTPDYHPECWITDVENDRYWHAEHGHWHPGPPTTKPPPRMARVTHFNHSNDPPPWCQIHGRVHRAKGGGFLVCGWEGPDPTFEAKP